MSIREFFEKVDLEKFQNHKTKLSKTEESWDATNKALSLRWGNVVSVLSRAHMLGM